MSRYVEMENCPAGNVWLTVGDWEDPDPEEDEELSLLRFLVSPTPRPTPKAIAKITTARTMKMSNRFQPPLLATAGLFLSSANGSLLCLLSSMTVYAGGLPSWLARGGASRHRREKGRCVDLGGTGGARVPENWPTASPSSAMILRRCSSPLRPRGERLAVEGGVDGVEFMGDWWSIASLMARNCCC